MSAANVDYVFGDLNWLREPQFEIVFKSGQPMCYIIASLKQLHLLADLNMVEHSANTYETAVRDRQKI